MNKKLFVLGLTIGVLTCCVATSAPADRSASPQKTGKASTVSSELDVAREELAKMRVRYKDEHPSVKAQLKKVADLEKLLAREKSAR